MPKAKRPYGVPEVLPCGCRLKRGKVWICTQVLKCKNGLYICRCADWWVWSDERKDLMPVSPPTAAGTV